MNTQSKTLKSTISRSPAIISLAGGVFFFLWILLWIAILSGYPYNYHDNPDMVISILLYIGIPGFLLGLVLSLIASVALKAIGKRNASAATKALRVIVIGLWVILYLAGLALAVLAVGMGATG